MDQIEQAAKIIKEGGIVIFPTDTAFGIGCRLDDEKAIKRLFAIRKRPETQATPVLVSDKKMAQEYLQPIPLVVSEKLIEHYWPGALTIVLPSLVDKVPPLARGGGKTLGVRMPDHEITLSLIEKVGVPLLGPSANFHGEQTPYSFEDLDAELVKSVDFVVKGSCKAKAASTVIDCSVEPWKILRQGVIKLMV